VLVRSVPGLRCVGVLVSLSLYYVFKVFDEFDATWRSLAVVGHLDWRVCTVIEDISLRPPQRELAVLLAVVLALLVALLIPMAVRRCPPLSRHVLVHGVGYDPFLALPFPFHWYPPCFPVNHLTYLFRRSRTTPGGLYIKRSLVSTPLRTSPLV